MASIAFFDCYSLSYTIKNKIRQILATYLMCMNPNSYFAQRLDYVLFTTQRFTRRCSTWLSFLMALIRVLVVRNPLDTDYQQLSEPKAAFGCIQAVTLLSGILSTVGYFQYVVTAASYSTSCNGSDPEEVYVMEESQLFSQNDHLLTKLYSLVDSLISKGVQYLHKSPVGYHGYLQASTCLIDINWVLKLTLYGVSNFICDNLDTKSIKSDEHAAPLLSYSQYACFAPEHLKEYDETGKLPPRMVRGSAHGDIYSVGMIFYSMVERVDPFDLNNSLVVPRPQLIKDIIDNNLMPRVDDNNHKEKMLLEKCQLCWHRDPESRPTIRDLLNTISAVYPASKGNLIDQMIRMSEKAAEELERQVAVRTDELAIAQLQTMRLLNEMLPATVAADLKNGIILPPRSYDSATVMFVQICEFNAIMKKSNANQVVFFLNDIFDQFDTVIKQHDAYKVETTGETYMVASGVPEENEGRHIFEVAEISLEIREISYTYILQHHPSYKLRIRIGFHAGPLAAGVIGIRSPRYCLFGDTVNFASRMQSNCPPNQIQTSEITAKLLFETHEYKLVKRGIVHVKGKGEVNCYWLNEHIHEEEHANEAAG
uniref:guanylate cyclase n=2 Tax=Caenorhabditis japonica TaxID=281687 RepID=A0A8R1DTV5_CAEJA